MHQSIDYLANKIFCFCPYKIPWFTLRDWNGCEPFVHVNLLPVILFKRRLDVIISFIIDSCASMVHSLNVMVRNFRENLLSYFILLQNSSVVRSFFHRSLPMQLEFVFMWRRVYEIYVNIIYIMKRCLQRVMFLCLK